jgi:hypothetical protein
MGALIGVLGFLGIGVAIILSGWILDKLFPTFSKDTKNYESNAQTPQNIKSQFYTDYVSMEKETETDEDDILVKYGNLIDTFDGYPFNNTLLPCIKYKIKTLLKSQYSMISNPDIQRRLKLSNDNVDAYLSTTRHCYTSLATFQDLQRKPQHFPNDDANEDSIDTNHWPDEKIRILGDGRILSFMRIRAMDDPTSAAWISTVRRELMALVDEFFEFETTHASLRKSIDLGP